MKRVVLVALTLVTVLLAVGTVFAGRYGLYRIRAAAYDSPGRFTLARVHPEFGPGLPAPVHDARIVYGELELLVGMGSCDAISGLTVQESARRVRVAVRSAGLGKTCTADMVPVYVHVRLRRPLGDRVLIDNTTRRRVDVATCGRLPEPHSGLCSPGWYGI